MGTGGAGGCPRADPGRLKSGNTAGTDAAAVSLMTGLIAKEIGDFGGVPDRGLAARAVAFRRDGSGVRTDHLVNSLPAELPTTVLELDEETS